MARRILLRLRHLLPFPVSFRLTSHLPEYVQSLTSRSRASNRPYKSHKLHATSYLDGLRGLAALIVCIAHYTEVNHPNLTPWYGVSSNPAQGLEPSWIQLPFVRVLFSGRPMVHLFFVISGFALSLKALPSARARDFAQCRSTLLSAALRRPIRVCGPPVISLLLIILFIRATHICGGILPTVTRQLEDWVSIVYQHVTWPWTWGIDFSPPYTVSLWTIPIELCHSMLLSLTVLGLSRLRTPGRMGFALAFVVYDLHYGKWAAAEFIAGMVLAEAHLVSAERGVYECLPLPSPCPGSSRGKEVESTEGKKGCLSSSTMKTILNTAILAAALFVAGWPNTDPSRALGIRHLVNFVPKAFDPHDSQGPQKFWFAIAAMGIVWSCGRLVFVRKTILESRFAQYAGRISFALYIVHGPVFSTLQDGVLGVSARPEKWVGSKGSGLRGWIGVDTAFNRTLCWAVGLAMILPFVLVTAHFFCRFVDDPVARLAKKLETWAVSDPDDELEWEMRGRQRVQDKRYA